MTVVRGVTGYARDGSELFVAKEVADSELAGTIRRFWDAGCVKVRVVDGPAHPDAVPFVSGLGSAFSAAGPDRHGAI